MPVTKVGLGPVLANPLHNYVDHVAGMEPDDSTLDGAYVLLRDGETIQCRTKLSATDRAFLNGQAAVIVDRRQYTNAPGQLDIMPPLYFSDEREAEQHWNGLLAADGDAEYEAPAALVLVKR